MDKNSWTRFPVPVIPTVPNSWKDTYTANADLIELNGNYLMYYRGTDKHHDRIGLMTCTKDEFDGIHWKDHPANPVIDVGKDGDFDDVNILDPSAVVYNDKVYLYYSAVGKKGESLGLAISGDGVRFEKYKGNPVLNARCPEVVLYNSKLYLYFVRRNSQGGYSIHLAMSGNGMDFTELPDPVFMVGAAGSWESYSVSTPRIFKEGDTFYMIYAGDDKALDDFRRFGLAVSKDLISWKKYQGNPIFEKGSGDAWDNSNIWFGTVEKINGRYWMWYEGCNHRRGYPDFISVVGAAVLDEPCLFIKPGPDF